MSSLLGLFALGAVQTLNLEVVEPAPTHLGPSAVVKERVLVRGIAEGLPSGPVQSSWAPYITCAINGGNLQVRFQARVDEWPDEFPESATCRVGDQDILLKLYETRTHVLSEGDVNASKGFLVQAPWGTWLSASHPFGGRRALVSDGPSEAYTSYGPWDGVACEEKGPRKNGSVALYVSDRATAGAGWCDVSAANGSTIAIPVVVMR